MSDCDVTLQYQNQQGGLWHSLGEYKPGVHTELGGGALMLPKESNVRVIETPTDEQSRQNPRVIQNYGRLGVGLPSLYIDKSMCSAPSAVSSSSQQQQQQQPPPQQQTSPLIRTGPPAWLWLSAAILALLALLVTLVDRKILFSKAKGTLRSFLHPK